ncbi:MAG: sterol desaturase family protein [Pseudomonadota bacterium]
MNHEVLAGLVADWPMHFRLAAVAGFISGVIIARYVVIAGIGFLVSMVVGRLAPWRRLQPVPFTRAQLLREIGYSMLTVIVFTGVIGCIIAMRRAGLTQLYFDPSEYGWAWFWLQIPVVLLIQDWYFYWMHRAVHMSPLYERVHKTHHLSTNPSAFSAFAFHPIEAMLEIAIFVVLIVVMPLHVTALFVAGFLSLIYNVYGHLGYEIMPRFIARSRIGSWLNTSAYHNQHHRTYRYNYGLYTVIWDKLHGTLHPKAEVVFDRASTPPSTGLRQD